MLSRICVLCLAVVATFSLTGCNNALNPLCGSSRPVPVIGSISPSTMTFAQVQQGATLTVNGSNFVSSSQIVINSTALAANVVSANQLTIKLGADVISGPGSVKIKVHTPSGNSGDLGCTSGGNSGVLVLTVD